MPSYADSDSKAKQDSPSTHRRHIALKSTIPSICTPCELRSSGIGKYVKLLSLHSKETPANKRCHAVCPICLRVLIVSSRCAQRSKGVRKLLFCR
eukprot:6207156-Pleurochrysis_carterae.AAC.2